MTLHGAGPREWQHFVDLKLTPDLLPVVSNLSATISPQSKMKGLGKTPSQYNTSNQVVGIADWTSKLTTHKDIVRWSKQPDYGICLQTRQVRAIDVDIPDPAEAALVANLLREYLLPRRGRDNSSKFLLAFEMPGTFSKRVLRTKHGIIEFLGDGQQCIVAGTHTSGSRYTWEGGLPDKIPTLSEAQFEEIWSTLEMTVSVGTPVASKAGVKASKLGTVHDNDPTAQYLLTNNKVLGTETDGRLHITCPFEDEHTSDTGIASTTYWPANTGGFKQGHFKCLHAHCEGRTDEEFLLGLGIAEDDFEDLTNTDEEEEGDNPLLRFQPVSAENYAKVIQPKWLVKGVVPEAGLVVLFGDSASGKSFMALDIAGAIAQGVDWRGKRVKQGAVVYVAAEGAAGVRLRLKAYAEGNGVKLENLNIWVIPAAPNLLLKDDAMDLSRAIKSIPNVVLTIIDTFAQTTPGGNENSGEDVGKALAHCRGIHVATKTTVMLIHHSGKDTSKGARGWSGLRAAADAELEVMRNNDDRVLTVTKQKDGEDGEEYGFKLQIVPVGFDEDDEVISSCCINHEHDTTRKAVNHKPPGRVERRVIDILGQLFADTGEGCRSDELSTKCIEIISEEQEKAPRLYNIQRAIRAAIERKEIIELDSGILEPAK